MKNCSALVLVLRENFNSIENFYMHRTFGYAIHISFGGLNTRHEIDVQLHFCVIDSTLIHNYGVSIEK